MGTIIIKDPRSLAITPLNFENFVFPSPAPFVKDSKNPTIRSNDLLMLFFSFLALLILP
ncbi:hypothetical protein SAMN06296241_1745 [Salinimicrobium sediminis]|uniref:Uncharacterized protein n=1 Tax=Salinimicrobium sediminis TaxID=1343891 RepID=A0A285X712_9FLAO|nr:hypothetical protein [Salinimicrobium sediminis]SOC80199.1 hypothetical protein SAMN06296241_1745 [Salinimicrobium sediminis]